MCKGVYNKCVILVTCKQDVRGCKEDATDGQLKGIQGMYGCINDSPGCEGT